MEPGLASQNPPHDIVELRRDDAWNGLTFGIALLLLLLLLGIMLFVWKKAWLRRAKTLSPSIAIDPWEAVFQAWQKLEVPDTTSPQDRENYFAALSFQLRQALELSSKMPFTSQTLSEIAASMKVQEIWSQESVKEWLYFLSYADQQKFAGADTQVQMAEQWHKKLGKWLQFLRTGVAEDE